ncbi:MAG: GNAT family N-acetyltransferase [Candidatus Hodarchaeota archaeon]
MIRNSEFVEEINDGNLVFRKITKEDAEFVFNSLNENELNLYLSLGPLKTIEDAKRLIKNYSKYWDNYLQFNYIIELHNVNKVKIGSISLWNINWKHYRAQVGIWITPSFWSKGLGEKSINLIKIIGFNHLKINRLEAYIALENKRSIFLFEKCGFKIEGTLRQYLNFQGKFHDAIILACIKNNGV